MKSRFLISQTIKKTPPETIEDAVKLRDEFRLIRLIRRWIKYHYCLEDPQFNLFLLRIKKERRCWYYLGSANA